MMVVSCSCIVESRGRVEAKEDESKERRERAKEDGFEYIVDTLYDISLLLLLLLSLQEKKSGASHPSTTFHS